MMAIIGILASMIMVNFIGVRQRSRDDIRKSDLHQMQSALELYRADNGLYPPNGLPWSNGATNSLCGDGVKMISPVDGSIVYMQKIPCDPLINKAYVYNSPDGGITYTITSCLENGNDSQQDKDSSGNPSMSSVCTTLPYSDPPFKASYTITNP